MNRDASRTEAGVVLLSGGLDSTTLLAYAIDAGFLPHAMTFRYGQRHAVEIEAAQRVARAFGVRDHVIVDIDLRTFGGSALTSDAAIPKDRPRHASRAHSRAAHRSHEAPDHRARYAPRSRLRHDVQLL